MPGQTLAHRPAFASYLTMKDDNESNRVAMGLFDNPFDSEHRLAAGCACGRHASQEAHDLASNAQALAAFLLGQRRSVTRPWSLSAVMRAVFPKMPRAGRS